MSIFWLILLQVTDVGLCSFRYDSSFVSLCGIMKKKTTFVVANYCNFELNYQETP